MDCMNLCDLIYRQDLQNGTFDRLFQKPYFAKPKRLYVGSYFCSQYFIKMDFLSELKQFLKVHPYALTLVIPVISEKDLSTAKGFISQIFRELPIDEVTVNDVGMLSTIHEKHPININLGRLFFKDEREIRVPAFFQKTVRPTNLDLLKPYIENYQIKYVELDPISSSLSLQLDSDIKIALHEPFCYMTTGNICKYASINKETAQKFRPNASCSMECKCMFETYTPSASAYTLYRIGRTIYFTTKRPQIVNGYVDRFIYFPFCELARIKKEGTSA